MILCDIGNSYYHFYKDGVSSKMELDATPRIKQGSDVDRTVYYISVNEEAEKNLLKHNKCVNLKEFISIASFYSEYELGIDRKVACYNQENGVIVDAGSAITVDVIHNREHLGGFILPGIEVTINNLKSISSALNKNINMGVDLQKFPTNTVDAISFGILKPIVLSIKNVSQNKNITFTGGDGKFLSKFFDNSIHNERLIFNNMLQIIKNNDLGGDE